MAATAHDGDVPLVLVIYYLSGPNRKHRFQQSLVLLRAYPLQRKPDICVVYRPLPRNVRFILASTYHVAILVLPFSPRPFEASLFWGSTFRCCSSGQPVVIRCTRFNFWLYFPISRFILGLQVAVECFHFGYGLSLLLQLMLLGISFITPQNIFPLPCPESRVCFHIVSVGLPHYIMFFHVFRNVFFHYNVLKLFDLLLFSIRN